MAKKFAIIHDLSQLNNEQRLQYLADASTFFGLDPSLNALDTLWMPDDVGTRKLVAYARKGTTDILRGIKKIKVTSLTQQPTTDGVVSYIAIGEDPDGRQEIALGAHAIQNLTGEKLASAYMTAQTRALRRLTLQFVGGGLLDASEVNPQTTDIGASAASLAQLSGSPAVVPPPIAPVAVPDAKPGKDITPDLDKEKTMEQFRADQKALRDEATRQLNERAKPTVDPLDNPPPAPVESTPEPKKRTPRKKRGVDISSPGQVSTVAEIPQVSEKTPNADILESKQTATPEPLPVATAIVGKSVIGNLNPVPEPVVPKKKKSNLPPEKLQEYQTRFGVYSTKILPDGRMQSAVNMGITTKLRKFAAIQTGTEINEMTIPQWDSFLGFLDDFMKTHTPVELVAHINKALGVD